MINAMTSYNHRRRRTLGKGLLAAMVLVGGCVGFAGCSKSEEKVLAGISAEAPAGGPSSPPSEHRPRIALVMKTLTNPFFIEMEKGARRAEKEFSVDLVVRTASQETSIEQQIQIVEQLIEARVDAIVIAPGDSKRIVPVLKRAMDAGVRLVNIDNPVDAKAATNEGLSAMPLVTVDNERAAYEAAKFMVRGFTSPAQAALIEGIRDAENGRQRAAGARRALLEKGGIDIVASESADWKIDKAHDVAKQIFTAHPNIKILYCANDMMALGALKYLEESGRADVVVGAYDALADARAAVRAGRLSVTVDQRADEQGYQGVALAVKLLRGEHVPGKALVDTALVTEKG